jgi:Holliday junction resolvasome RuvABC endonuclease subunit
MLLPGCSDLMLASDAADALAVAICHASSYRLAEKIRIAK